MRLIALTALLLAFCAACTPTLHGSAAGRPASDTLDESSARLRAMQLSEVSYELDMQLDAGSPEYRGEVIIRFGFNSRGAPLTIDFGGGTVEAMSVNGGSFKAADYNGFFITVPAAALRAGSNDVRIRYRHPWSTESSGLFRFTDPEDGRSYVYTDFEAYAANRAFPCFDQPDIKASYTLGVEVPASWQVISATRETRVSDSGDTRRWTFARSARFSTYLFSLHTGEYQVWEDREARIPSRLFARHSIAAHVPVDDWFRWTRAGFGFFEDYFGIAYPFLKYDQVLVPEYASGAMENVAAVVFDENLVGRGQLTATARETIANTILHEMAHMWFGNLVTMQWWNGLWLNESFANFMAFLALAEATEFRDAWHSFYASEKTWAYRDDARATTHPIEVVVADARSSFANFDGISYGKGAAILKQLYFLLGPEAFRSGVSAYLRERAWRNARLEDFVAALAQASGRNLDAWTREWLLAAGTNTVRATVQCTAGQLQSLTLLQSAPAARPQLRSQRLEVALYREGDGSPYQVIDTVVAGASSAVSIPGQIACPDFVWPNHRDWAFARLGLGPADLDFLQRNLMQFDDPLMRNMIWQTLWHMVEDGTLALPDFLQLALQFEAAEHDPRTLASIHYRIAAAFDLALRIGAAGGLPVAVPELMQQLRRDAWWEVLTAAAASDSQKIWLDHYLRIAGGEEDLAILARLLGEDRETLGWSLDQPRRWTLLGYLAAGGYPGALQLAQAERARDPSSSGELAWLGVQAALPELPLKGAMLERLIGGQADNTAAASAIMNHLFPPSQMALQRVFAARILAALALLDSTRSEYFMADYVRLFPVLCDTASAQLLAAALASSAPLGKLAHDGLVVALEDNDRCMAIRDAELQIRP
ncbi:MAG: aminopeptidase N [Gammaproteobacteria bacterium]|nr:aminopeptidase N [Gammaproteobacteria bacterium]